MRPKTQRFESPLAMSRPRAEHRRAGLTLIEVIVFFSVVSIAMLGALSVYSRQQLGGRLTEQRRRAMLIAEEKMDEIRSFISQNSLDAAFICYGPTPAADALTGTRRCCSFGFDGAGAPIQNPVFADLPPIPGRQTVTVTIITSERPSEGAFGLNYNGTAAPTALRVDINGNGRYTDTTNIEPFPIDINNNGNTTDLVVTSGFCLLPVCITVQWLGPYGAMERVNVFAVLTNDTLRSGG